MRLSRCALVLMVSLAIGWRSWSQEAGGRGKAEDGQPKIAGVWRGHSECAIKSSPCHDEVNVYRFSKIAGRVNVFSVTASKIVDRKEIVMGSGEWKYDENKKVVECEKPTIRLSIDGDKMEGAFTLEDGTLYRRIYLRKES